MSEFSGLYNIRDGKTEDHAFIYATFLKGLYYGDSWYSLIDKRSFMDNYKLAVQALLKKRLIKVACLQDDPDVIIGYSIMTHDFQTIDWVFVKEVWRKKGVASSLVPTHPVQVTHLTKVGLSLLPKINSPKFNPFAN